jgi:hypothetical protein
MGTQRHVAIWVADLLQYIGLVDIHGGDVWVMDAELLLQIVISFKKLLFAQQPEIKKS